MQLIQIGFTPAKTLHQLIEEMAARQFTEVAQLKEAAVERNSAAQLRRTSRTRSISRRTRCKNRSSHPVIRALAL